MLCISANKLLFLLNIPPLSHDMACIFNTVETWPSNYLFGDVIDDSNL